MTGLGDMAGLPPSDAPLNFSGDPRGGEGLNWVNGARHSVSRVTFGSLSATILFL